MAQLREMTRKHGKKEVGKRLENDGLEYKEETENTGLFERVKKKPKRLPSLESLRDELVYQLRESLPASQEKMNNPELTFAERHRWTQVHLGHLPDHSSLGLRILSLTEINALIPDMSNSGVRRR